MTEALRDEVPVPPPGTRVRLRDLALR
ncbi:hypothetical protein GA0115252_16494, partial [Streptomyces sp. DfronAA-171]